MKGKPKIGLTMRLDSVKRRFYLGRDYSEALESLGALPVHLSLIPNQSYISGSLDSFDGILLPGSDSDVDPLIYKKEPSPKLGTIVPEKDETDLLVLREAEKLALPVLGICFGMQVLNVFRGGTLIQDIESEVQTGLQHEQGAPSDAYCHNININEKSLLRRLAQSNTIEVNSYHHQAIDKLGNNLKINASAKDGIIEGIEDVREDRYLLGVQWHPELNWKIDKVSKNIFQSFIKACSEFASKRK